MVQPHSCERYIISKLFSLKYNCYTAMKHHHVHNIQNSLTVIRIMFHAVIPPQGKSVLMTGRSKRSASDCCTFVLDFCNYTQISPQCFQLDVPHAAKVEVTLRLQQLFWREGIQPVHDSWDCSGNCVTSADSCWDLWLGALGLQEYSPSQ